MAEDGYLTHLSSLDARGRGLIASLPPPRPAQRRWKLGVVPQGHVGHGRRVPGVPGPTNFLPLFLRQANRKDLCCVASFRVPRHKRPAVLQRGVATGPTCEAVSQCPRTHHLALFLWHATAAKPPRHANARCARPKTARHRRRPPGTGPGACVPGHIDTLAFSVPWSSDRTGLRCRCGRTRAGSAGAREPKGTEARSLPGGRVFYISSRLRLNDGPIEAPGDELAPRNVVARPGRIRSCSIRVTEPVKRFITSGYGCGKQGYCGRVWKFVRSGERARI